MRALPTDAPADELGEQSPLSSASTSPSSEPPSRSSVTWRVAETLRRLAVPDARPTLAARAPGEPSRGE